MARKKMNFFENIITPIDFGMVCFVVAYHP